MQIYSAIIVIFFDDILNEVHRMYLPFQKRDKGWKKDGTFNIVGTETGNGSWEYGKDYLRLMTQVNAGSFSLWSVVACDTFSLDSYLILFS